MKKLNRILLALLKIIGAGLLWLAVFIASWGFYVAGLFFTFNSDWLSAIISLLFALVMEIKTFVSHRTRKRPKDLIDRIKRARIGARNNQYPYRETGYQRDMNRERSAYEHGFDAGCNFILNLEDK